MFLIRQNKKDDILLKLLLIIRSPKKTDNIKKVVFLRVWINLWNKILVDKLLKIRKVLFKAFMIIRWNW